MSGKEFQEDGAATANARLARCLCVLGINKFPRVVDRRRVSLHGTHSSDKYKAEHGFKIYTPEYTSVMLLCCVL